MKFIAMDFETANYLHHSACAIGLVFVDDNQIVEEYYSLIRPETAFSEKNIAVHGIYPRDVIDAPKFPDIWEDIRLFFEAWPLVIAHNMRFDYKILAGTLRYYQLTTPRIMTLDTVLTSRHFLKGQVRNNRLNTLAEYYQIPLRHHDALDDARACAKILIHQHEAHGDDAIRPFIKGLATKEIFLNNKQSP